jgi:hypothetical protein
VQLMAPVRPTCGWHTRRMRPSRNISAYGGGQVDTSCSRGNHAPDLDLDVIVRQQDMIALYAMLGCWAVSDCQIGRDRIDGVLPSRDYNFGLFLRSLTEFLCGLISFCVETISAT